MSERNGTVRVQLGTARRRGRRHTVTSPLRLQRLCVRGPTETGHRPLSNPECHTPCGPRRALGSALHVPEGTEGLLGGGRRGGRADGGGQAAERARQRGRERLLWGLGGRRRVARRCVAHVAKVGSPNACALARGCWSRCGAPHGEHAHARSGRARGDACTLYSCIAVWARVTVRPHHPANTSNSKLKQHAARTRV